MKPLLKVIFIISLSQCFFYNSFAQTAPEPALSSIQTGIGIPPLNELIDAAIKHNAMVRYRNLEIASKESNLKSKRNNWTRNLGFQADTRYGTFDNFSSSEDGQSTSFFNSTSKQFNYGVGLYMKLPIFDVVNRKTEIKQAKSELEQAKSLAESQQDETRQLVIRQYQEALLKQKLLIITSQNLGSAKVNMEMVEKEFRNGVIPIAEYVRISDMTSRIQSEYETAKSNFLLNKRLLENLVGYTFGKTALN